MQQKERTIRAVFDDRTITIYQAYNRDIARTATRHQTFQSPPFSMNRMTWIKPSFLWMMYRSGWSTKENQEHVLAIKIKREGFEGLLDNACLSHFDPSFHPSIEHWKTQLAQTNVRIQWDPEKDIHLQNLPYRSIQIGLTGTAVQHYVADWIVQIDDISQHCKTIHQMILAGQLSQATAFLPIEEAYPLPQSIQAKIHHS